MALVQFSVLGQTLSVSFYGKDRRATAEIVTMVRAIGILVRHRAFLLQQSLSLLQRGVFTVYEGIKRCLSVCHGFARRHTAVHTLEAVRAGLDSTWSLHR